MRFPRPAAAAAAGPFRQVGALTLVGLLVAGSAWGCSAGAGQRPVAPTGAATPSSVRPSQTPVSWTEHCTSQVAYWAGQVLSGRDGGYDYQEMGLSGLSYEALQAVLARPDRSTRPAWVRAEAARQCRARAATAARQPSGPAGGWPP